MSNRFAAAPKTSPTADLGPSVIADAQRIVAIYVAFARRNRLLLLALPLLFAAGAAGLTFAKPRTYEGQLVVAFSRPTSSDESSLPVASFRPFLENHTILDETIKELKLDQPPFDLRRTALLREHYQVEPIRNTNLVTVRFSLTDPVLVARFLNKISDRAAQLVKDSTGAAGSQAQELLKTQLDTAAGRMKDAERALETFRNASQIELLRRDIDSMLHQRGALLDLSVQIDAERSRLTQAEADLKAHERIQRLTQKVADDPILSEVARQAQEAGRSSVLGLSMQSEYANPVYQQIDAAAAKARSDLAGLQEQRRQLIQAKHLDAAQSPLLTKLYAAEGTLAQLETEQKAAQEVYRQIAGSYQLASVHALERGVQLIVIDRALPPDLPQPRGLLTKTAIAFGAGLMLAILVILFRRPAVAIIERG